MEEHNLCRMIGDFYVCVFNNGMELTLARAVLVREHGLSATPNTVHIDLNISKA